MKKKEEILKDLYCTLAELESNTGGKDLRNYLRIELQILYDILGEDVKEEYWERIEEEIRKED